MNISDQGIDFLFDDLEISLVKMLKATRECRASQTTLHQWHFCPFALYMHRWLIGVLKNLVALEDLDNQGY